MAANRATIDAVRWGKLLLKLYWLPACLLAIAYVPVMNNIVFSGHGGPGWLILPFSFPLLLFQLFKIVRSGQRSLTFALTNTIVYLIITFPLANLAEQSITTYSGLPIEKYSFHRLMILPVGFLIP